MVVIVGKLFQERPRLENKGRKYDLGKVHPRPDLLDQEPDDRLVLVRNLLSLKEEVKYQQRL